MTFDGTEIGIDKNVPMPRQRYPWRAMEVGDSFFVPGTSAYRFDVGTRNRRLAPRRFAARTVTEDGVRGVRVWRVA